MIRPMSRRDIRRDIRRSFPAVTVPPTRPIDTYRYLAISRQSVVKQITTLQNQTYGNLGAPPLDWIW